MVHSCPECGYETDTGQGLSVHFGMNHNGNMSDYDVDTSMTDKQVNATSKYDRPEKDVLQELSDKGLTFTEMAERVNSNATRHTISHWFDVLNIDHDNQGQTSSGNGNYRNEEWLQSQFDSGKILTEIAKSVGVSHKTIEKWVKRFDIDYTPANTKPAGDGRYRDKEWMQKMHDKIDDQKEIAKICDASLSVVNKWAKKLNIDYESRYERQRNPNADWREKSKWNETRFAVYQRDDYTCQDCGKSDCEVHAHHTEFVSNGGAKYDMDNLVTLCKNCHMSIHNGGN